MLSAWLGSFFLHCAGLPGNSLLFLREYGISIEKGERKIVSGFFIKICRNRDKREKPL